MELCRQDCALPPDRFEENITALFQNLYCTPARIGGILNEITAAPELLQ